MCRRAVQRWPAANGLAAQARDLVAARCNAWELWPLAGDAQLITSELVTNAVLHAGTAVTLHLHVAAGMLHLAVEDDYPLHPEVLPSRADLLADVDSIADLSSSPDAADTDLRDPSLHVGPSRSVAAGRGLLIVSAIAEYWGSTRISTHSKAVWARLPVHPQWPYLGQCPCLNATSHTPSGAPVTHISGPWDGPQL